MGEDGDVRDVVGVHDREGVRDVVLGAGLVAEDAERDEHDVQRTEAGHDVVEHLALAVEVVGVELDPMDRGRAGVAQAALGLVEVVGATSGEDHRAPLASRRATASPISLRPPSTSTVPATPRSLPPSPCAGDDEAPHLQLAGYVRRRRRSRRRRRAAAPRWPSGRRG